ncbi:MAG: FAD-dependent oxidoreductase [Patescibacteria group bacterium]|jgi:alkyl hydroperoxide reductase subunit F
MYDVVILGGGPAGLAAAVYFARQKLKFALLTKDIGGYALLSDDVENYLGFHLLNGMELVKKFQEHLKDYEGQFELKEGEPASKVEKMKGGFLVTTEKGAYETRTILIATGTTHRKLNVPGEDLLYGKGVTYCANCDAPLFKDKKVFVVGGGNSAMDAALFLEKYTTGIVIVTVNANLGGDALIKEKILSSKNISVLTGTKTAQIVGSTRVTGISLVGPDGKERLESAEGVFIEIGLQPITDFIQIVEKDKAGQIVIDKHNQTSVEGIYGAGDVTDVTEKQIAVAVGEGSKAALQIIAWLQKNA